MNTYEFEHVANLIPEAAPYLLIDKILELDINNRIVAIKNLSMSDICFQGQIGKQAMPSSLFLEMMVQAGTALLNANKDLSGQQVRFKEVKSLHIERAVFPGDQCRIELDCQIKEEQNTCEAIVFVEGKVAATSTFILQRSQMPSRPKIHPTASVHPSAVLGKDVIVGPYSIIGESVFIGNRSIIEAHVMIDKWTRIGEDNHIHFGSVIGSAPQDLKYHGERSWVTIGDRNHIREYVTINRATGKGEITKVGSDNMFLTNVHIGHNCEIGSHITLANMVHIGGHASIDDRTVIGGLTGIHQFVRVGTGVMAGGYSRLTQDIPPFMLCDGNPAQVRNLNVVGLRRRQTPISVLKDLKTAFKLLYKESLNIQQCVEKLEQLESSPPLDTLITFLKTSTSRGILKKTDDTDDHDDT